MAGFLRSNVLLSLLRSKNKTNATVTENKFPTIRKTAIIRYDLKKHEDYLDQLDWQRGARLLHIWTS